MSFIITKKLIKMIIGTAVIKLPLSIVLILLLQSTVASAQVYNNGSIRIIKGGSIISIGSFTNESGAIINDGRIEVWKNFDNNGNYSSNRKQDSLVLTGDGAVALNSGSATIGNLRVNKANGGGVTLTKSTTIGKKFNLEAGYFSTDPQTNFELVAPAAATFIFAARTEITGKVRRTNWINDSSVIYHQPGMVVKTSGGIPPKSLLVNMIPGKEPTASAEGVKRYFYFSPQGGVNYTADVNFPYNFNEFGANNGSNLVAWYFDPLNNWNQKITGNTSNTTSHYVTSAGIKASILADKEWKLAEMNFDNKMPDLYVYPIPATTTLNIYLAAERNKNVAIELSDVSGKICKQFRKQLQKGLNKLNINIIGLSSGQYILKVAEGNRVQTKVVLIN